MRRFIPIVAWLPALFFVGCGGGGDSMSTRLASAGLGEEFVLGHGESADVGPLSLEFIAVTEDSRCATDGIAVCVWQGNGRILVSATLVSATQGSQSQVLTLNTHPGYETFAVFAGHIIELRRLDPQPVSTRRPAEQEYAATLFVDAQRVPAAP